MGLLGRGRPVLSGYAVFACAILLALAAAPARAERRVALVIGNSAYEEGALKNPVNDARAIRARLGQLGFAQGDIVYRENLKVREIGPTLREFKARLSADSVALIFYAGHGLQVNGENYLPAVDARIEGEEDVSQYSLKLSQLMTVLAVSQSRMNLVFLDACRNNPYKRAFRDASRGLARARDETPSGTLISYATRANDVAADGKGDNGVFTRALLAHMGEPGQPIEQMLKKVVRSVKAETNGKQEPWQEGSYEGDFYFVPAGATPPGQLAGPRAAPAAAAFSLDDLNRQNTAQAASQANWVKWQAGMNKAYAEVASFSGAAALQTAAWERFLGAYAQDNPFSGEDDAMRGRGRTKLLEAQKRMAAPTAANKSFKDCDDCPEMVVIPPGSFMLGSPATEKERDGNEGPQRRVTIGAAFAVGKYTVTFDQWEACTGVGSCRAHRPNDRGWGRANRPVINVDWADAQLYVAWLSHKTGKQYRLLSEAEWEYAARAGTSTARYWGPEPGKGKANCKDCASQWGGNQTAPVGSFAPNGFGLYDMLGNVWQMTEDCWNGSHAGAPANGSVRRKGECGEHAARGGSWTSDAASLRSARRGLSEPGHRTGFRVARALP